MVPAVLNNPPLVVVPSDWPMRLVLPNGPNDRPPGFCWLFWPKSPVLPNPVLFPAGFDGVIKLQKRVKVKMTENVAMMRLFYSFNPTYQSP